MEKPPIPIINGFLENSRCYSGKKEEYKEDYLEIRDLLIGKLKELFSEASAIEKIIDDINTFIQNLIEKEESPTIKNLLKNSTFEIESDEKAETAMISVNLNSLFGDESVEQQTSEETKLSFEIFRLRKNNSNPKETFLNFLKRESLDTIKLYINVMKKPTLLIKGFYSVVKDLFYELPKSFFSKKGTTLEEKTSQALALSEMMTIPGSFLGATVFQSFELGDILSGTLGANLGNYLFTLSYIPFYTILTRSNKEYSLKKAVIDSARNIKDAFPSAVILYATEAPIISLFLTLGLPFNLAVGITVLLGMTVYAGMVKYSASQNIKNPESPEPSQ